MTETNFTNEQLKVWASLGPWCQPDGPEYGVMLDRVPGRPIHGFLGQPIFDKQPHDDWFEQEMANAALIAAAPALAAALLAERTAREVEVGELRDMMQTVRGLLTPDWRGYCDAAAAVQIIDQAMKGQRDE